ncbi:MAG: 3-hydroxyacyl-CoA dehydrogenase [SAR324 cluster bacterium]|nr:3-hydroxyacyl-CoA dehydrogenase [SAR324 cluster bacterium]MCZ6557413.1 3-hydroxyacyl-CoA dehydrogenase [SAR324 cluster bacterium]MCZ6629626.1 3-hydroxyacyl-CoA dehydrogenase [SAR324 cluster bacterium]MCZ6645457.1 3-hydroxyacyl-CoA dehydrogenase [SAR324 cluster bacterium]
MDIKGSAALITGGVSGLGGATARALHAAGAGVVMVDLNDELGAAAVEEVGEDRAVYVHGDVRSEQEMAAAVATATTKFGSLQIVVNCAGIGHSARVLGRQGPMEFDFFKNVVEVNLIGTFNTIRLAAQPMAENTPNEDGERGVIVNTASVAAYEGQIGQAPYSASKGGIVGMTLPIAREFAQHGIRVMTIAPGIFDTPLLGRMPEEIRQSLADQVPFPRRLGRPEEFADLVLHIIVSPMLNGETIRLDGSIRMAPR